MKNIGFIWLGAFFIIMLGFISQSTGLVFIGIIGGFFMTIFALAGSISWNDGSDYKHNDYTVHSEYVQPEPEQKSYSNPRYIIPEIKRQLLARQGNICAHPQCSHTYNLQLHHIIPFEQGGDNSPNNLVYLCPNHHAQAHSNARLKRYMKPQEVIQ